VVLEGGEVEAGLLSELGKRHSFLRALTLRADERAEK
jgi:hypothetical protein